MMCYLDKTFCISQGCKNKCNRQVTEELRKEAARAGLPLSYGYLCEDNNDKTKSV